MGIGIDRRSGLVGAVVVAALMGVLAFAGSASAKTVYDWNYAKSFNGSDAVPNESLEYYYQGLRNLKIDDASHSLYAALTPKEEVGGKNDDRLYKFNLNGQSSPWSAFEPDTWLSHTHIDRMFAVDNSGGPTQGRIYGLKNFGEEGIYAYEPSGEPVGGNFPILINGFGTCGIAVDPQGNIWITHFIFNIGFEKEPTGFLEEFNPSGEPTGKRIPTESVTSGSVNGPCELEIDSQGNFWYSEGGTAGFEGNAHFHGSFTKILPDGTKLRGAIDPEGNNESRYESVDQSNGELFITSDQKETIREYDSEGGLETEFGPEGGDPKWTFQRRGLAVDATSHAVFISNGQRIDKYVRGAGTEVPTAKTGGADISPTSATLHATINGDGIDTTECTFQWGPGLRESEFNHFTPCAEGNVFSGGSGDHSVHAEITGLTKGLEYHYRLVARNANNVPSYGRSVAFRASSPPAMEDVGASKVDTGGAHLTAELLANGSYTHFRFEYGTEPGNYTGSFPLSPPENADYEAKSSTPKHLDFPLTGLEPETTYYFRLVAVNDAGTTVSSEQKFHTFAKDPTVEPCPNAHVRQQTGTRLLLDCRAYELVSAANAGGYDVESDLTLGQTPLVNSPLVNGRALYALHYGTIPGIAGNPTDFGHDPYLAVRGDQGWTTEYVGLPANGMADPAPYGSPLLATDGGMTEFAFGGEHICEPCFEDGSTNIPLRRGDTIEKGMRGSQEPAGDPSGLVAAPFSRDGTHFVFQSQALFETAGDPGGSVYDRNLTSGVTQVVSTKPDGSTIVGGEVGELGISADGSRVLVGERLGTDGNGNSYWHLYMHLGTSPNSVDVTPGTTSGVLYAGMSADGSAVFFSTRDKLLPADTDNSADIYEARLNGAGPVDLSLVSVDGTTPSNDDSCTPSEEWNTVSGGPDCSAVALAGGAGVSDNGTIYFLSPEQLDGSNGEAGEANVYVHSAGQPTRFVATIDNGTIDDPTVVHALSQAETHSYGDFQVSSDGRFALFSAQQSLTGYPNGGHYLLYRYDQESESLDCASCPVTGITATADTSPPPFGLGLTDDGKVFFTTTEQLVLKDTNQIADAYEWEKVDGASKQGLISNGMSPLDSHLLGVSADGVDAFFFTHEVLSPLDENGNSVKLYDARAGGGFPFLPAEKACVASDECHGPGTEAPPPPNINTVTGGGEGRGNVSGSGTHCKRGFVLRHGKCVKRKNGHRHHRRHHRGAHHG